MFVPFDLHQIPKFYHKMPRYYHETNMGEFQIMPNHIHGIIIIGTNFRVGAGPCARPINNGQAQRPAPTGLSDIVHHFKSLTTKQYIVGVKQNNWPPLL